MGISRSADSVVEEVVAAYGSAAELSWIHGQGSVFCGFSETSDLDFIAVWDEATPTARTARPRLR